MKFTVLINSEDGIYTSDRPLENRYNIQLLLNFPKNADRYGVVRSVPCLLDILTTLGTHILHRKQTLRIHRWIQLPFKLTGGAVARLQINHREAVVN